jgi:selenocysteine lyase/cysteine desulfurase
LALRTDAGRYECGTLNTIGIFGLRAALEFILGIGVDRIAPAVQHLADRAAEAARNRGYTLLQQRTPETAAGIVSFRRNDIDSRLVARRLSEAGFMVAPRQGWVRVSPHFYIDPQEIDRLGEALA